jgi:hypothetical protein
MRKASISAKESQPLDLGQAKLSFGGKSPGNRASEQELYRPGKAMEVSVDIKSEIG